MIVFVTVKLTAETDPIWHPAESKVLGAFHTKNQAEDAVAEDCGGDLSALKHQVYGPTVETFEGQDVVYSVTRHSVPKAEFTDE